MKKFNENRSDYNVHESVMRYSAIIFSEMNLHSADQGEFIDTIDLNGRIDPNDSMNVNLRNAVYRDCQFLSHTNMK